MVYDTYYKYSTTVYQLTLVLPHIGHQTATRVFRKATMNLARLTLVAGVILLNLPGSTGAAVPTVDVQRGRVYVERPSGSLAADVYMPHGSGPFPGMLVVHGGAWTAGSRDELAPIARAFAERGYTAVAITYRLAPQYKFPAQIYDCEAAVRWMRSHAKELKIDPDRIGGFGYSAGGHLVALLGTIHDNDLREPGIAADAPSARLEVVLAGGAPCDFRVMAEGNKQLSYWLGGSRAEKPDVYREASPATYIQSDDPPMFFFHGENDLLVPISSPTRMVGLLKNAGVAAEIYTVKGAGHIQAIFSRPAVERAMGFADRYLKPKNPIMAGADRARATHTDHDKAADRELSGAQSGAADGN
ncbi:MAG TPA: alpha/beta hydrolase [Lacipirellulaceae bacterium]|nr:alpha/beta hydrolase [Lacipirellulaceae bacterium]